MTKNESVIEEVTRKMQAMTKPMTESQIRILAHHELLEAMSNPKLPAGHTLTDAKQIMLLAAAEESYSQAASVLHTALSEMLDIDGPWDRKSVGMRLHTGLHLLEEAMNNHNIYRESMK